MPCELVALRTHDDFATHLAALVPGLRVAGPQGAPIGFSAIRGDEMHQLFLSPAARGTGLGALLLADAEERLAEAGHGLAWLDCAIGNDQAIRFYERNGWTRRGEEILALSTVSGTFDAKVLIMEKRLNPTA